MRAIRFSIGFPPLIARSQVGDTEYALGAIPLGGYVKIPGMLRPEAGDLWEVGELLERGEQLPEHDAPRSASPTTRSAATSPSAGCDAARGTRWRGAASALIAAAEPHLTDRAGASAPRADVRARSSRRRPARLLALRAVAAAGRDPGRPGDERAARPS